MLTATASPIHLRAPCEFLFTFLKRKVFEGITSAADFPSPSQLSRHQGMRATFAHSAPRFMPVLNREPYATRQNKQQQKTDPARYRVGQLTCSVAGRGLTDAVRGASFSGSKARSESGTWQHKLPLHSFKFSHGASRTVILVCHHWKARHRAADESARRDSNRSMEGGTG